MPTEGVYALDLAATILTGPAAASLESIHISMPVVIPKEAYA